MYRQGGDLVLGRETGSKSLFLGYRCLQCGSLSPLGTKCCRCGGRLLLAEYKLESFEDFCSGEPGVWRFLPLLPPLDRRLSRGEGGTPLLPSRRWSSRLGIELFFKDESMNPSGSFKDRGVAVMMSALNPATDETVVMMSSGNAASSVALYAALAGVHAIVLMYQGGTREKAFMTRVYGATVFAVQAEREAEVLSLAEEIAVKMKWPLMNTVAAGNPLILEGYKTLAYEIVGEIGDVDAVVVPVGSGTLLSGIWKGFKELYQLGRIRKAPKLIGVQPVGSCPIVKAFQKGLSEVPKLPGSPRTVATALTLDDPGESGALALRAVQESEGGLIAVDDEAILEVCRSLASEETIVAEPAGAAGAAGLAKALDEGLIQPGERVICVITGHGLKDIKPVEQLIPPMVNINPRLSDFKEKYGDVFGELNGC